MPKMRVIDAAVVMMEKEDIATVFDMPGATISPLYSVLRKAGDIDRVLARYVEGASHMAEGYARAEPDNIGVCIGTSGPAGTDMVTGLYSAWADSIPTLCITGQAPHARLYKGDSQAVDIESITKPVTKRAITVREPALVPHVFQQAFYLMRSGRSDPVLIDLPLDVQIAEIEFNPNTYSPLPVYKPVATRAQAECAIRVLCQAEYSLLVYGGGVINTDMAKLVVEFAELMNVPVVPTLMGWGVLADDHPPNTGMVGLQTSYCYGNATLLASDFALDIGNHRANRHTGSIGVYTKGREFVHVDTKPTQIGRVFGPDLGITLGAKVAPEKSIEIARELGAIGKLPCRKSWNADMQKRRRTMLCRPDFDNVPIKPQHMYHGMNQYLPQKGEDSIRYASTIDLPQIVATRFPSVNQPHHWISCRQADPLGWTIPAAIDTEAALPNSDVIVILGDYGFQFTIEEMAVVAQFKVSYIHVVVNNSCLGLIRQAQRNFDMDYCIQFAFDSVSTPELNDHGVDHVEVVGGLGCKAIHVFKPEDTEPAFAQVCLLMAEFSASAMMEVVLERMTSVAMGTEIDNVVESEDVLDLEDTPTEAEGVTA